MKVRLLVARATVSGLQDIGDEIDVTDAEAIRMVDAGQAVPVRTARAPERAVRRAARATEAAAR